MPTSRLDILRWQFDLTWSLFEYHLERLEPDDALWEPAGLCWTVHPGADGGWEPDFAEQEPDPVPVPTIAWTTWHISWWWTVTIDHLRGRTPTERTAIRWPGDTARAVELLRRLRAEWVDVLGGLRDDELDAPASFPWQGDPSYTVGHTLAWVNTELAKNVAEIGQLRLLRAAG